MLKELRKNKMSVVVTGILFGVMGVLIIPIIAGIVKILGTLSQKYPRIYKYSMIAFIIMLLAISLFYFYETSDYFSCNSNLFSNEIMRCYI